MVQVCESYKNKCCLGRLDKSVHILAGKFLRRIVFPRKRQASAELTLVEAKKASVLNLERHFGAVHALAHA